MQCPSCTALVPEGSLTCPSCGTHIPIKGDSLGENNATGMPVFKRIRHNLYIIELIELSILGILFSLLVGLIGGSQTIEQNGVGTFLATLFVVMWVIIFVILFLWGVYMVHIRVARAGGQSVDIGLWIVITVVTGTFTLWCWTILDINRLILSKIVYKGSAPVEFAWSHSSKQRRKEWEEMRKIEDTHSKTIATFSKQTRSEKEKPLSQDINNLLLQLQAALAYTRKEAGKKLGELTVSDERIVIALMNVRETDGNIDVRNAAAEALLAPVHQAILRDTTLTPMLAAVQTQIETKKAKIQAAEVQQAVASKRASIVQAVGWILVIGGIIVSLISYTNASTTASFVGFATYRIYWGPVLFGIILMMLSRR